MEEPDASTHSGAAPPAAARSAAAIVDGCIVDISGLPLRLTAADLPRGAVLAAALGRLPAHPGPPEVELSFGIPLPRVPEAPPDESYAGSYRLWRRGDELHLAHGTATAGHATRARIDFGGEPVPQLRHLVPLALGHVLGFTDRFVLHAGVITSGERTALVLGDSGAGKSTVVISAREAGWTAMGDDMAVVQREGDVVTVSTLGAPLTFPGELWTQPVPGSTPLTGDPRRRLTSEAPAPGERLTVTDLVVPFHDVRTDGTLEAADSMSAFETVVGSFVAVAEPSLLRRFAPVAARLAQATAWRVGSPPDPVARLSVVGSRLAGIVRSGDL